MWMSMMMRLDNSSRRGDEASTSAAISPAVVPPMSRPRKKPVATMTAPPIAMGSRSLHSDTPNSRYDAATCQ